MAAFDRSDRQFEELLLDGISAVKTGRKRLAESLLNRATILKSSDARPYLWLSATTDDPDEQQEYLEQAVACDPSNVSARRGLAMLTGKIDKERLVSEDGITATGGTPGGVDGRARSFKCPQCGGRMSYSVSSGLLVCEYCGNQTSLEDASGSPTPVGDRVEQVLDFVMPTEQAHRWAESQHRLSCEHCGAVSLLLPAQKASQCSYCGSNQFVESLELGELIDPHLIAPLKIDEKEANAIAKRWLGKGFFSPDNLLSESKGMRLRPGYYSSWIFDGTLEAKWSAEVAEGSGNSRRWVAVTGAHTQFFDNVLVPGVKALTERELASVEPFDLVHVEEFKPEYLAGWPAMIYDRSLSDASLLAREKVIKQIRPQLYNYVLVGSEKRNVNLISSGWSGMTFKHVLLPLWIGTYHFQGQEYHLLVNGQTGKIGGVKPRDSFKLFMVALIVVMFLIILLGGYWYWNQVGGLF